MDCFSLLACLPSLGPIAAHISDKSKHLRKRKIMHTIDSRLLTKTSLPCNAASDMPSPTKSSLDDRQSQMSDMEKQEGPLQSETLEAKCNALELE